MKQDIYLYRDCRASDFICTDTAKEIIPVRLRTPYIKASSWYRNGKWEDLPPEIEQQMPDKMNNPAVNIDNDDKYAYCEFVENMLNPKRPNFTDKWTNDWSKAADIEDYTADEMS
ncbi:MAG: hypothetical protein IKP67_07855, partial [Spirochaetales bacterium]|nr:hypothetical protein [Spirochaetales bacterium]